MISNENAALGLSIANNLGLRKLHLATLVEDVYKLSITPNILEDLSKNELYTTIEAEEIYEASVVRGLDERVHHDIAMESLVAKGVAGISGIVDMVTNIVNPWANETRNSIDHGITGVIHQHNPPQVKPKFLVDFESVPFFVDMIEDNKATTRNEKLTLPKELLVASDYIRSRTETELFAMVSSGNVVLDTFLKGLIPSAKETWTGFGEQGNYNDTAFLVVHYAYLNKLLSHPPENLNMSLSEFGLIVTNFKKQIALSTSIAIKTNERRVNGGYLFTKVYNPRLDDWRVEVYGDVYNKWLAQGGSLEALYGVVLAGKSAFKATDLTNYKLYEEHYEFHKTTMNSKIAAKYKEIAHNLVLHKLESYRIKELPDVSARQFEVHVKEHLAKLENPSSNNIDLWLRKAFCACCAKNDTIINFILELSEVGKSNPNLKLAECAELARVHITADWLASLVIPVVE